MKHIRTPVQSSATKVLEPDKSGHLAELLHVYSVRDSDGFERLVLDAHYAAHEISLALNLFDRMVDAIQAQWDVDKMLLAGRVHVLADTQSELDDYFLRAHKARRMRLDILDLLRGEGYQ